MVGCFGSPEKKETKKTAFAPKKTEVTKVDFHPTSTDDVGVSHGVKLSVMVPEDFTATERNLMQGKLLQIATRGGVSGIGGNPTIVLAPLFAKTDEGVTATTPSKNYIKYNITFYVANVITGDVYGSASVDVMGVGDSNERARMNAIESISVTDQSVNKMIGDAEKQIINYYTQNGDKIIAQAQSLAASNDLDAAINLLGSIPMECGEIYTKAQEVLVPIFEQNLKIYTEENFAKMKSCLATTTPESMKEAMFYFQQIPMSSELYEAANTLYETSKTKLDADAKANAEAERARIEREFEGNKEIKLLEAKMNVSAQEELLDKYKKDAAYDRLPWLRKLVYMGDMDPFDGYND